MLVTILPGCGSDSYEGESSGSKRKRDTRSAGLYEPGTKEMIKSWDELVEEGTVMVINGEVISGWVHGTQRNTSSDKLYGDLVLHKNVTIIGEGAFAYCNRLTGITLPDSVTSIEDRAFDDCAFLTNITIPNSVTNIGGFAFRGCSSITSITIPNSVINIGDSAFNGCKNLTNVTIGEGVISIGRLVFDHCPNLTCITFTGTKEEWENIEKWAGSFTDVPAEKLVCSDGAVNLH